MIVLQGATAISKGLKTPFYPSGGVGPYTYSVLPDGAGGTIDTNGLYTAPQAFGRDTIQITDSTPVTPLVATASIGIMSPVQLVCEVIQKEMGLTADQVYFYNQKINLPRDSRLYVAVGILNAKPFGNSNTKVPVGADLVEEQVVNMQNIISIDIMSRGMDAVYRKEEVLMALNSQYSQNQQTANSFYVAKISSSFTNLSDQDGAAIPYRFNISVGMQYALKKSKPVPYYDTIEFEVITNE